MKKCGILVHLFLDGDLRAAEATLSGIGLLFGLQVAMPWFQTKWGVTVLSVGGEEIWGSLLVLAAVVHLVLLNCGAVKRRWAALMVMGGIGVFFGWRNAWFNIDSSITLALFGHALLTWWCAIRVLATIQEGEGVDKP